MVVVFMTFFYAVLLFIQNERESTTRIELQHLSLDFSQTFNERLHESIGDLQYPGRVLVLFEQTTLSQFQTITKQAFRSDTGLLIIEWQPRVPESRRRAFENHVRQQGLTDFRMWELDDSGQPIPAQVRDYHVPVLFLSTRDNAQQDVNTLGLDLTWSPERMSSKWAARDSGRAQASALFRVVTGPENKYNPLGFAVTTPIYKEGIVPLTVQSKRENLVGYLAAVYSLQDMMSNELTQLTDAGFNVNLRDSQGGDLQLSRHSGDASVFSHQIDINLLNQTIQLELTATRALLRKNFKMSWFILPVCLLIFGSLVFWLLVLLERKNRLLHNTNGALENSLIFNRAVLNGLDSHIAVVDLTGIILMVNDAWIHFARENGAGHLVDRFVGMNYLTVSKGAANNENADTATRGIQSVLSGQAEHFETQYPCHSPTKQQWFQLTCRRLPISNTGAVLAHSDITTIKQMEEQVRQQAYFDLLTGLPNRRLLADRFSQAKAAMQRSGELGALMVLDLDNFKPLNDEYGHTVGDLLLVEVGKRLMASVRSVDTVARFGGDEFVVLLNGLCSNIEQATEEAMQIAEKIRRRFAETYVLTATSEELPETTVEHRSTVTIGMTVYNSEETDLDRLFNRADSAMYQAKSAGKNQVRIATGPDRKSD